MLLCSLVLQFSRDYFPSVALSGIAFSGHAVSGVEVDLVIMLPEGSKGLCLLGCIQVSS